MKKSHGTILPPRIKPLKTPHECAMPFFDKPVGTFHRCRCGQVWYKMYKVDSHGKNVSGDEYICNTWVKSTLDQWILAGGSPSAKVPSKFLGFWPLGIVCAFIILGALYAYLSH